MRRLRRFGLSLNGLHLRWRRWPVAVSFGFGLLLVLGLLAQLRCCSPLMLIVHNGTDAMAWWAVTRSQPGRFPENVGGDLDPHRSIIIPGVWLRGERYGIIAINGVECYSQLEAPPPLALVTRIEITQDGIRWPAYLQCFFDRRGPFGVEAEDLKPYPGFDRK